MRHNQSDAVAVAPSSWEEAERTGPDDCEMLEPAAMFAPGVTSLEHCSLQRSSTFGSSTASFSGATPAFGPAESAQSIRSVVEFGEAVSREDASSCAPATPGADADGDDASASSIPSPKLEEDLWMTPDEVDRSSENVNLDAAFSERSLDQNGLLIHSTWTHGSRGDDFSLSQLDELLQMDIQEFDSGLLPASAEDLCPSLLSQDFPLEESVATTPLESPPGYPSECSSKEILRNAEEPVEDVSQVFAQWFKRNAHLFSLSDLRKIKLKTSTIEDATRRLGGGKKGLLYFVKLILLWLQNHHFKRSDGDTLEPMKFPSTGFVEEHVGMSSRVGSGTISVSSCTLAGVSNGCVKDDRSPRATGFRNERLDSAFVSGGGVSCSLFSNPEAVRRIHDRGNGVYVSPPLVRRESEWNVTQSVNAAVENGGVTSWFGAGSSVEDRNLQRSPATGLSASRGTCASTCDSLALRPNTPAATTRAARKNRMERQRWSVRRYRKRPTFSSADFAWSYQAAGSMSHDFTYSPGSCQKLGRSTLEVQQGRKAERNLKLLFQKELKQSDVGNLGRIVVPKKAAETSLPQLDLKDGVNLVVEDMDSFKVWNMRYRFWPNNKSRMYLLENTGDFVKSHNLKEGDYMMLYSNSLTNNYLIRGVKGERSDTAYSVSEKCYFDSSAHNGCGVGKTLTSECMVMDLVGVNKSDHLNGCLALNGSTTDIVVSESTCDYESSDMDDSLFAKLIEQSLDDVSNP